MAADDKGTDTAKWGRRHESAKGGQSGPNVALIIGAIIALYLVIFFFTNGHTVRIDFVVYHKTMQTRWLILICIVLGVIADQLFTRWWGHRKQKPDENK